MAIKQPVGQVRLTNVAVVRLRRRGKRFELACYKNKVMNWRNGVESDIDEVLQTHTIFSNVSKGVAAKKADLTAAFNEEDQEKIVLEILRKGELQVSDRERQLQQENVFNDVATIVSNKCINRETNRPFPLSIIENAMREIHFNVNANKGAKQQALEVIRQLQQVLPIARAQMRLVVAASSKDGKRVKTALQSLVSEVVSENWTGSFSMVCLIDPGSYRQIEDLVQQETRGQGSIEILDLAVQEEGDEKFE